MLNKKVSGSSLWEAKLPEETAEIDDCRFGSCIVTRLRLHPCHARTIVVSLEGTGAHFKNTYYRFFSGSLCCNERRNRSAISSHRISQRNRSAKSKIRSGNATNSETRFGSGPGPRHRSEGASVPGAFRLRSVPPTRSSVSTLMAAVAGSRTNGVKTPRTPSISTTLP